MNPFKKNVKVNDIIFGLADMVGQLDQLEQRLDGEAIVIQGKILDLEDQKTANQLESVRANSIGTKIQALIT